MEKTLLCDLVKGEEAVIENLSTAGALRRRLMDLGFIGGTKIKCVRVSPFGDPKAYSLRGTVIALRKEDAAGIEVLK